MIDSGENGSTVAEYILLFFPNLFSYQLRVELHILLQRL